MGRLQRDLETSYINIQDLMFNNTLLKNKVQDFIPFHDRKHNAKQKNYNIFLLK